MVCRWQTVEDGAPREYVYEAIKNEGIVGDPKEIALKHAEHKYIALPLRMGTGKPLMRTHLVIRASRITGGITAACEFVNTGEDDGA